MPDFAVINPVVSNVVVSIPPFTSAFPLTSIVSALILVAVMVDTVKVVPSMVVVVIPPSARRLSM